MAYEQIFKVAIFDEFLDAFARIPRSKQKKVSKFLRKFRQDPTQSSLNYEPISTFADSQLRTVRIDLEYRAIVRQPERGNTYLLLWVDHHDKAMRWAQNKSVSVHPETGALQVFSSQGDASAVAAEQKTPAPAAIALFDGIRDRELLRLGVPEPQLASVRGLGTGEELEALASQLPPEAFEALYWLSEGEPLDDVERAMAVSAESDVDTDDIERALERDASKRRFVVVEDDASLEAMLDAPLEKWRIFLHPSQRQLVERSWNGPVRVLGGAGTGKTVVAMHRAAYLAHKVFHRPGERILFTTFTKNLAQDIRANLARLCSPEVLSRIDVVNIDKWVRDLLLRAGYEYKIQYWNPGKGRLAELWNTAVSLGSGLHFSPSFYRDEWEAVVQAQNCKTWQDYKRASRSGRGIRLSRAQRRAIWPVFEEYRHRLDQHGLREPEDALHDAANLLTSGQVRPAIRSIVVDEAQDMSTNAFRLLRAAVAEQLDDLFIVGDGHQRIYRKRVVLSHAGVNIRGRGRRLRVNYRTTDEIRRYAVALLEDEEFDDLDGTSDSRQGYRSLTHGEPPRTLELPTFDDEVETIAGWLAGLETAHACLVARTNALADRYADALEDHGVATLRLGRDTSDDVKRTGLRVATMHRVKGLEYDHMIVAGLSDENMPWRARVRYSKDRSVQQEAELMERALLYVALTRARKSALVTAHGTISEWVASQVASQG